MIDCSLCKKHCCGQIPKLRPVLLPEEVDNFKEEDREFKFGVWLLKQFDGKCVYRGEDGCTIYENRPLECRLYPYIFDFNDPFLVVLDDRFCEQYDDFVDDEIVDSAKYIAERLSDDWKKRHMKAPVNG